jgi:phosphopantothenoylcysteine decarboxylase/phosphopantothenate--cysteine ligase
MNVILGITGSIAAYKGLVVARSLTKRGIHVRTVFTENAAKFVTPLSFESLTGEPAYTTLFPVPNPSPTPFHLSLSDWGDLLAVAPASANFIAKAAWGVADDLLSTLFVAFRGPVLVAPAMHDNMWIADSVQHNVSLLKKRGIRFVGPTEGDLATGSGKGRLSEPGEIVEAILSRLHGGTNLMGLKVLVAYGRTEEDLDPVRVITNRSSGRLGAEIARRAQQLGGEVEIVCGPGAEIPTEVDIVHWVRTSAELKAILSKRVPSSDVFVMAVAVSDFRPERSLKRKTKRKGKLSVSFVPTEDILLGLARRKKQKQLFVGFALESENLLKNARAKLASKKVDMIVANDLKAMDSDEIEGYILRKGKKNVPFGRLSKSEFAKIFFDEVSKALP